MKTPPHEKKSMNSQKEKNPRKKIVLFDPRIFFSALKNFMFDFQCDSKSLVAVDNVASVVVAVIVVVCVIIGEIAVVVVAVVVHVCVVIADVV